MGKAFIVPGRSSGGTVSGGNFFGGGGADSFRGALLKSPSLFREEPPGVLPPASGSQPPAPAPLQRRHPSCSVKCSNITASHQLQPPLCKEPTARMFDPPKHQHR